MKGILLAGGTGSRLWPASAVVNKHLLPVYDKPMVYYPLSTLMLAGCTQVLLISTAASIEGFRSLLGDGSDLGISVQYAVQDEPRGIADALLIAENFLEAQPFCLILGDNLLYGGSLGEALQSESPERGATIFAHPVTHPSDYAVVELGESGEVLSLTEKPTVPASNLAVPGIYFYDSSAIVIAKETSPSARGELEITDVNREFHRRGLLRVRRLPRGSAWLDMGNARDLNTASTFVRMVFERQGEMIGSPEEVAWRIGRISGEQLRELLVRLPNCAYRDYLASLARVV